MGCRLWNNFIDVAQRKHDDWKKILQDFNNKDGIPRQHKMAIGSTQGTIRTTVRQRWSNMQCWLEWLIWLENHVHGGRIMSNNKDIVWGVATSAIVARLCWPWSWLNFSIWNLTVFLIVINITYHFLVPNIIYIQLRPLHQLLSVANCNIPSLSTVSSQCRLIASKGIPL